MKIHLAGGEISYDDEIIQNGGTHRLMSAFSLNYKKDITKHIEKYETLLLDSGGFSARQHDIKIDVRDFARYLIKNKVKIAFNLDTNDIKETLRNQDFLEKYTDTYIIPVYHLSDYTNKKYRYLLDHYIEKYPYISIGGVAKTSGTADVKRKFYNYVFSKTRNITKVHGLGITSQKEMRTYPFYSVDSTSWLAVARYGKGIYKGNCHSCWSAIDKGLAKTTDKIKYEIQHFVRLEKEMTKLWEKRGVVWENH